MFSVSEKYLESVVSDSRDMVHRVTLDGGLVLDKTKVPKLTLDENIGSNEGVSLGTANSATLRFTMKDAVATDYNGMMIEPESGLVLSDGSTEWLPLGKFWVTDFSTSNDFNTVEFTCADGMYHMTGEYVSELTYPAHIRDVAREIVSQSGVEFDEPAEWPEIYVRRRTDGLTHREAIGYVAGCCGSNARFNRYGKLEFTWYKDSGVVISREIQYLDGLTKLNYKPLEVNFEITGQTETYTVNVISDGNGGITATPGHNVLEDETVVLSVNPFGGHELSSIFAETERGENVILYQRAEGGYTFVQPDSNVIVTASFREKNATAFKLSVRAYDGGSIDYDKSEHELGENYFNEGDEVTVHVYPDADKEIDELFFTPKNLNYTQSGLTYSFKMPKSDVTFRVYFKEKEKEEEVKTPYSWLQKPAIPPTSKPYWAIFYKDDANLPTCQKYHLIWFDRWSGSIGGALNNRSEYNISISGCYYCGSKNNGTDKHEWDNSAWNGNGEQNSYVNWRSFIGSKWANTDEERLGDYWCLLVSNIDLKMQYGAEDFYTLFEANEDLILDVQTSYIDNNGMDIREEGTLSYFKCPDTFSTPLPAKSWMVLMPESGLYMTIDSYGKYQTPISSYPKTMIAFFYDSISIQNIGAVNSSSNEKFYIASVTNGQWAYLRNDLQNWDEIHTLPEGAVIGFRNPLISTEPCFVYNNGDSYQFSGILATNTDLYVGAELFMHNNACRICDCVSEVPTTFSLMRTATPVSAETDTEKVTMTYTNPMIYEKMVEPISSLVQGVTYTPAKLKYRGNPALQAGDIVQAPDKDGVYHNILIIQQTLNFGGGLNGEITCPGKTAKTKSFSAISPITTQIKKEVQKSNVDLEKRLASNNALVFNSMYKEIGESETKIKSVVEFQTEQNATIAKIDQTADENKSKIALVVGQNGIVNEDGAVQGSVIVEAINGESSATIKADKINFEGQELNIKVPSTNIVGQINAEQINADGIEAKDVRITGDVVVNSMLLEDCAVVARTDTGTVPKEIIKVTCRVSGMPATVYVTAEKAVPEDVTVSVVASGTICSSVMSKGTNTTSIYIGTATSVSFPAYIYIYEDDTYMTVSKGIMPYTSGTLQLGAPNHRWKEIYADTSVINTSDEREKNSISEIPQEYSDLFYKLKPVIYKMNNGTSDRFHTGFIAQSVEEAMSECGIDSKDFAGLIKSPIGDDFKYGLRYSEFIALAVLEIQKLNKKIEELERKVNGE